MPIVCWITKAADTHSVYFIVLLFHGNSGYANASPCYVILTLPDFLFSCPVEAYIDVLQRADRQTMESCGRCVKAGFRKRSPNQWVKVKAAQ
jgi:hypothetical protein